MRRGDFTAGCSTLARRASEGGKLVAIPRLRVGLVCSHEYSRLAFVGTLRIVTENSVLEASSTGGICLQSVDGQRQSIQGGFIS